MAAVTYTPQPLPPGFALQDGSQLNALIAKDQGVSTDGAIANGTTKATGTQIVANMTYFATVGASGQAILPPALPGINVIVVNAGANTLTLNPFEASGTTIDGAATTTLSAANRVANFYCKAPGTWISWLGGAVSS
jgi:hypothetical protein